jgi:uncharacterized short protein YbdD (DUF466 family)
MIPVTPAKAGVHSEDAPRTSMDSGLRRNDVDKENAVAIFWRTLRTLTGDDAYDKYCEHHLAHHANEPVLDQRAFYLQNQQKKWGGINRCC